jgi:hypothetical protein
MLKIQLFITFLFVSKLRLFEQSSCFWLLNINSVSLILCIMCVSSFHFSHLLWIYCLGTWILVFALTLILLMWRIGWAPNSIPIHIQQDATLYNLYTSGNCSTCFGWYFHPSSGAYTTVSTASGICHTVTAICRYRGRVGTGLSVLWVAYATPSTLKPVPTLPR